jgi:outer membrane protein TolC
MTPEEYRQQADDLVYPQVEDTRREVLGREPGAFDIEPAEDSLRARLDAELAARGTDPEAPWPSLENLTLVDCLEIAAENSRQFQTRREQLYQTALSLTVQQWRFQAQPGGGGSAGVDGNLEEATLASGFAGLSLDRLFGFGATVLSDIGLGLQRSLTSSDGWSPVTTAGISITQPLLQGFGRRIVVEPLTQAERNLLYEVRSYERFRRTFAFDVADRYFRILQSVANLDNELNNARSLTAVRERNEALAERGRLSDIQLDQARQNELAAENRVIDTRQSLQGQLDNFKLFLGLPVQMDLTLDIDELTSRVDDGLKEIELDQETAIRVALRGRYDHLTTLDRVIDAERQIYITEDALEGVLNFVTTVNAESDPDELFNFDSNEVTWSAGIDFTLPVNQVPERNAYRNAIIGVNRARRDAVESADTIVADIRDRFRELTTRKQSFEIQDLSTQLSERRVESARLNLEAGRAQTRDLLESQDALIASQNARVGAAVDYQLAVLAFYRDLEVLAFDGGGLRLDQERLDELLAGLAADAAAAAAPSAPTDGDAQALRTDRPSVPQDTTAPLESGAGA